MKKSILLLSILCLVSVLLLNTQTVTAQNKSDTDNSHNTQLNSEKSKNTAVTKTVHVSKEDFPKGNVINLLIGWGDMAVAINEPPAGSDFTPLLKSQKDGLCQVPHWGYLEKGAVKVIHKDKSSEIIKSGEVFYMPPGHTVIVIEDSRLIDFSPEKPMADLVDDINKILASSKD